MPGFFKEYGIVSDGILNLSPNESLLLLNSGAILVDVREEYLNNFKNFDVPELICMPKSRLLNDYSSLPHDRYLIFADTVGLRSKEAVIFLIEKGFDKVANMAGGIVDWERDGLPITADISNRLSGSCMCQLKTREKGRGGDGEIGRKK
jgi:rhodanese-related sulfurtransferase